MERPVSDSRQRYLDALGIERYLRPAADATPAAGSVQTAAEPAPQAAAPAGIEAVAAGSGAGAGPSAAGSAGGGAGGADVAAATEALHALEREVSQCRLCALCETRTQTVFGVGDPNADCMLVGEAPGAEEDRQGKPFVGRAGHLLVAMLGAIGMERDEVYIANVLKCRPPRNRDPGGTEVITCEPYLHRQVELVAPRLIVAMGRFAAQSLLRTTEAIGRLRGREFTYRDTGIPLIVTYHPAYLLRNPADKRKSWDDLLLIKRTLTGVSGSGGE